MGSALWSDDYLHFWKSIPLDERRGQSLYKTMLFEENWGGVWNNIPVNRKRIRPLSLRTVRLLAKMICGVAGRDNWHNVERRYFNYWLSTTGNYAVVGYLESVSKKELARNGMSWHVEKYLSEFRDSQNLS